MFQSCKIYDFSIMQIVLCVQYPESQKHISKKSRSEFSNSIFGGRRRDNCVPRAIEIKCWVGKILPQIYEVCRID